MVDSPSTVETNETASTEAPASIGASTPAPSGAEKDVSSASSPESGKSQSTAAENRESLLDAVRKVVPHKDAQVHDGAKAQPTGQGASPAPNAQEGAELGPITKEELDGYHPRTRKRISKLLAENDGLKRQIAPLEAQAKTTTELQAFLKQADIAKEDFGLVLDLAAAMRRGDFKAFLEGVTPYVTLAQENLGLALPKDLQAAVQQGHMTEDAARYVAQQRGMRQLAEAKAQRLTEQRTVETADQQRQRFQTFVQQAVADWETGIRKSDPDYARKEPVVRDLLAAVVQERGPPRSPQEAVAIAQAAYDRANAVVSRFTPQPRATRQAPSSLTRVNGALPQPNSLREAAMMALERSR